MLWPMPSLDAVSFISPGSLGAGVEVTVADIASPTELNSRPATQGDILLARTAEAGSSNQTWYYADATSDAESLPFIVSSATAGVKFVATAGYACRRTTLQTPLASTSGGTGVNNAGTITNASNTTITGGGTLDLGGFTLTVPATGTVGLLGTANTWTQTNAFAAITATTIGGTTITASTRLVGISAPIGVYGIETSSGTASYNTTTDTNNRYALATRRVANTSATGAHNARAISGELFGAIASGQTNSGAWSGLWYEALRNYVATGDTGTLATIEGARLTVGHFNTDASTPTTTTIKGLYMPLYRSSGTIGTMYGIHIDSLTTSVTPTTGYGIKIENTTGTTAYAIYTGTGLVRFGDEVLTTASTTTRAGLNIPHGSAPSSPVDGDMWTTTAGLFVRINGVTVGPLS